MQAVPEIAERAAAGDGLPAHPAVDGAQGRPSLQRRRIGALPPQPTGACAANRWRVWKFQHDNTAITADDPLVAGRAGCRQRRSWSARSPTTELRRATHAGLPVPLQAGAARRRLLPRTAAGPCRAGHRSHRPDHRDVDRDRDRLRWSTSTRSCWQRDSRPADYLSGIEVDRHRRAESARAVGCRPQRLPRRRRSADSRTSSCSTGPNTNQGGNSIVYILEAGARLVASAVTRLARRGGHLEVPRRGRKAVQRADRRRSGAQRSGRGATATSGHRPGASSPNGPTPNSSTRGARGGCGRRDWIHHDAQPMLKSMTPRINSPVQAGPRRRR